MATRNQKPETRNLVCIIGVGNAHRGDDGVGIWVARRIAAAGWAGVATVVLNDRDGTALLAAWQGMDAAYVVDAVDGDVAPGTIVRLEVRQQPWGGLRALSSHGLGLGEAVELGRALGMLPGRLVIYGVVGRSFTHGEGLSPEVLRAAERVVGRLRRAVARRGR